MSQLLEALLMMFCLSFFALVMLIVAVAIFKPHKRRIPPHQIVRHASDRLPYQLDNYGGQDANQDDMPSPLMKPLLAAAEQDHQWGQRVRAEGARGHERAYNQKFEQAKAGYRTGQLDEDRRIVRRIMDGME